MYNMPYLNPTYNAQANIDRINAQMAELEEMKKRLQQPPQQQMPTSLTQNFQLAPTNREIIRYAGSLEEVQRDMVIGDTPYFSKDMSVVWIKNTKGDIKTYELTEIVPKDEKDIKIDFLMAQIEELKKGMSKNESKAIIDESIANTDESQESSNVSNVSKSTKKSK